LIIGKTVSVFVNGARSFLGRGTAVAESEASSINSKGSSQPAEPVPGENIAASIPRAVATPYGDALQSADAAAIAARTQVEQGATLYRIGTMGKSQAAEAQFWSLENPASPGYAARYGIPAENVANSNFIETATVKPGTTFVTRQAPGVGENPGGGIEVVVPSGGVQMKSFSTH